MEKKKVVLLSPFSLGAASCKRLYYLSRHLNVNKRLFLVGEDKYGKTEKEDWFQYTSQRRDDRYYPAYLLNVIRLLIKERPDIIHYNKPHHLTLIPALIYKKLFRCKLVFDCDDWEPAIQEELGAGRRKLLVVEKLMKLGFEKSDAIIVHNTNLKKEVPAEFQKKVYMITNGVDTKKFRPLPARKNSGIFNAVYVGTLHKITTITPLVEAIGIAASSIPNLRCTIVGGGKGEKELRQLIKEKNASNAFRLLGTQPHEKIPQLLSQADALLMPCTRLKSLEYASNMKLFEYMAMQKPIVAVRIGDTPAILEEGKAGYIAQPDSPRSIAGKLVEIFKNPKEADKKARRARKLAVERYDWDVLSKKLEEVYRRI
jgi:glycosyltransferase involved in cell wall biosynthesis